MWIFKTYLILNGWVKLLNRRARLLLLEFLEPRHLLSSFRTAIRKSTTGHQLYRVDLIPLFTSHYHLYLLEAMVLVSSMCFPKEIIGDWDEVGKSDINEALHLSARTTAHEKVSWSGTVTLQGKAGLILTCNKLISTVNLTRFPWWCQPVSTPCQCLSNTLEDRREHC